MHIVIASNNPNKIRAVQELLTEHSFFHPYSLTNVTVPSGVSNQPLSLEETVQGASNRARAAYKNCEYSFGIESGIFRITYGTTTKHINVTACIIYDGTEDDLGLSSGFELEPEITTPMYTEGIELDEAVQRAGLTTNLHIGYAQGLIGIISRGKTNRKDYTKPAVEMAMFKLFKRKKSLTAKNEV
ncbi:MAG: inosine/xanthosine triphosphatase [Nanoarchaeota archaeon]|nr:inosine/xanthosine triphosphatase [Nanoarchaeota archaeon]